MQETGTLKKRSPGLDIVRCVAMFFVISVHFFLYTGFYSYPVNSPVMYLAIAIRDISYTCVPLFMLLSGYLLSNKKVERKYFKGIWHILYVYVAACIATVIFNITVQHINVTFSGFIKSFFEFSTTEPYRLAAPYAWYVNMYIGLFLLAPFLNLIYNGLDSKKKKQLLIIIMLFLTSLPVFINGKSTVTPIIPGIDFNLLPNWWTVIYPITYYFIGAYIKEYQVKISKLMCSLAIFAVVLFDVAAVKIQSKGLAYTTTIDGYGNLPVAILSVLIFLLLYDINVEGQGAKNLFKTISSLSLGTFLVSYIFDRIIYSYLNAHVIDFPNRLKYYIIATPIIFFASIALSAVIEAIYKLYLRIKNNSLKQSEANNEVQAIVIEAPQSDNNEELASKTENITK